MVKTKFLKTKIGAGIIALVAIAAGFIFLNKGITGNAVYEGAYTGNILSGIGATLVVCAAVLAIYSLLRR